MIFQIEKRALPDYILIKFDDITIESKIYDEDGYVAITPTVTSFKETRKYGDVERRMIPPF